MSEAETTPPSPSPASGTSPTTEATPGPSEASAPEVASPSTGRKRPSKTFLMVLIFLLVSQPLLLLVVLLPYWWAALPILSVWGILGWKRTWLWSLLVGFLLGFGYWGIQLLFLPAVPRDRLAAIIASGIGGAGTPVYLAYVIGPLLFGLLSAFAALTVAGGLRLWDDVRPGRQEAGLPPTKNGSEA